MSQITWETGDGYTDVDLSGRELFVKFAGFRREPDDPARLLVKTSLAYGYVERDGKVYKRGTQTEPETLVVNAGDCYQDKFYWRFEVVTGEFVGEEAPYSTRMKGIAFPGQTRIKFITGPQKSGFIQTAEACGLNLSALDDGSQLFDPGYFHPDWIAGLEAPLSFEQVLLKLVEPKLLQIAEDGHIVKVRTQPDSNWIKWDSFVPLSPDAARRLVEADDTAEELRRRIKAGVPALYTASDVANKAGEVHPDLSRTSPILDQLDEGELERLLALLVPDPSL